MLTQSNVYNEYSINVVVYIHIGVDSTINSSSCVYVRCLCECVCSKHVIVMGGCLVCVLCLTIVRVKTDLTRRFP